MAPPSDFTEIFNANWPRVCAYVARRTRAPDDVVARAAEALRAHQTVFTDAHKIEFGKVVTREKSWTTPTRRRVETYTPDGRLESVIVSTPTGSSSPAPTAPSKSFAALRSHPSFAGTR